MPHTLTLRIAGVYIELRSEVALWEQVAGKHACVHPRLMRNFLVGQRPRPDIIVDVLVTDTLPGLRAAVPAFTTHHFQTRAENWRLYRLGRRYAFTCPLPDKQQVVFVEPDFTRATAYLLPKNRLHAQAWGMDAVIRRYRGYIWSTVDIIYDFLQVLLINYLSRRRQGIFTHSSGLKDVDGRGLVFNGRSGAGKSTMARLWHRNTRAQVLNDDRIIITRQKGGWVMHPSPWHGAFQDYLDRKLSCADLRALFFIHHGRENAAERLSPGEAFPLFYPGLFPTFWDRSSLENIASLALEMVSSVPCYRLGFVKGTRVIEYLRTLRRR